MTASFKGILSKKEQLIITISLLSLIAWIFPALGKVHAETATPQKSFVFEIKPQLEIQNETIQIDNQKTLLAVEQQNQFALIDKEVTLVRGYLQSKNSPLADYTEILLAQKDWKRIIAISNAESNMCIHQLDYNCSGIFGQNGLRQYGSFAEWIVDMQTLLDHRYSTMSLDQMDGVYVQPRSTNWYRASTQVLYDLTNLETQFSVPTTSQT